jgi:hypothetical protein
MAMPESASQLRKQAAKARQISSQIKDRDVRQMLIFLAEKFEEQAKRVENEGGET